MVVNIIELTTLSLVVHLAVFIAESGLERYCEQSWRRRRRLGGMYQQQKVSVFSLLY